MGKFSVPDKANSKLDLNLNPALLLKINEVKVGYSVIDILENWETIFNIDNYERGSNIYAKNKVLYVLREMTLLNSKEIRNALKIYRSIYELLKKEIYIDK